MKCSAIMTVLLLTMSSTLYGQEIQQFDYLWIQLHGLDDNVVVVSSNGPPEVVAPVVTDESKEMKLSTASVMKRAKTYLKVIEEKEAQGWSLFQIDDGVWIMRRPRT